MIRCEPVHFHWTSKWVASNRIPLLCVKDSGIATGQTLQVPTKKCTAKRCFGVKKTIFWGNPGLFCSCTGFEPMTSVIPVQCSTNWATKPTRSWSLCWFQINPWNHFTKQKRFKENQEYPEAIDHGIKEEENAKFYDSKVSEKQPCSFDLQRPGVLISHSYSWIGASLDGIRTCQCYDPTVVEIKCPFKGKDLDPKNCFPATNCWWKKRKVQIFFLTKITYIISKFRLTWQFQV